MRMTAPLAMLGALVLVRGNLVSANVLLKIEWIVQNFNKGVRIVAVEFVLARLPAAVVGDPWTALWIVKEQIGRPSEVLLAMRIVTLAPIVDD